MAEQIVIEPITRIEGHARISLLLDEVGRVAEARFQVTQVRGFEQCGRPAVLRDAGADRTHLRHLPGEPRPGLGQGL